LNEVINALLNACNIKPILYLQMIEIIQETILQLLIRFILV